MRHANRPWKSVCAAMAAMAAMAALVALSCGLPVAFAAIETADAPAAEGVAGAWQHHQVTFGYVGFTSLYTCGGLENRVSQILLQMGARKDVKVTARGCPGTFNTPSRTASVHADFYTLAPVAGAGGSDTVRTRWAAVEVTPRRPDFMGDGDCELVQGMKDLITKNFTLRDIEYRTSCTPHQLTLDGFAIKGQALKALPLTSSAAVG
jgi:hypothetical protein